MKALIIFGVIFIFTYIGVQPYVASFNQMLAMIISYICDAIVIAVLVTIFIYYSRYGKSDSFLSQAENEINDAGYYISPRATKESDVLISELINDYKSNGYNINREFEVTDFTFDVKAWHNNSFIYTVSVDNLDKNDVLAYLDEVITDVTVKSVKRKANAVLCFVTDKAADDAIALSKMITPLGKKEQIKIALCIYELSTNNVYFLGNDPSKCQSMIANNILGVDVPISKEYIHNEKLQFQYDIEEKMKNFNIKDFKNDNFYIH